MSDFFINAGIAVAVLTGVIYYEGWLFLRKLRRCYAAHVSGIRVMRESYLVTGAYAFHWWPFYAIFFIAILIYLFAPGKMTGYGAFWFYTAALVLLLLLLQHLTPVRANTMFCKVAQKGFSFHPEVKTLCLAGEQESEELRALKKHIENNFRLLERDSTTIVMFKPHCNSQSDLEKIEDIEIVEIPLSKIVALAVKGQPHFPCQPDVPLWRKLLLGAKSAVGV